MTHGQMLQARRPPFGTVVNANQQESNGMDESSFFLTDYPGIDAIYVLFSVTSNM